MTGYTVHDRLFDLLSGILLCYMHLVFYMMTDCVDFNLSRTLLILLGREENNILFLSFIVTTC